MCAPPVRLFARAFCLLTVASVTASEPEAPEQDGVLLLKNGNVLRGEIVARRDRYEIAGAGYALDIATADVAWSGASLVAAYEHQRGKLTKSSASDHLRLAEWCLRHELWPQAARELVDARGHDQHHPRLELFERRLAIASTRTARPGSDDSSRNARAFAVDRSSDTARVGTVGSGNLKDEEADLAALIESLPEGALPEFSRRIQPILVNNCSTVGCHDEAAARRFRLSRALLYGESNRENTLRNLAATLAEIDRESPESSSLLTFSTEPHGRLAESVFPPHRLRVYQHLVDWVELVAQKSDGRGKTSTDNATDDSTRLTEERHTGKSIYARFGQQASAVSRRNADQAQFHPRDPFDPEIFNRQSRERSARRLKPE